MNRCTGHCCRSFFIPSSPGALRIGALAAIRGRGADVQEGRLAYRSVLRVYRWGFHAIPTGWFHFVSRAELCRAYPYGKVCEHDACTWRAVRAVYDLAVAGDVRPRGWLAIRQLAARATRRAWGALTP